MREIDRIQNGQRPSNRSHPAECFTFGSSAAPIASIAPRTRNVAPRFRSTSSLRAAPMRAARSGSASKPAPGGTQSSRHSRRWRRRPHQMPRPFRENFPWKGRRSGLYQTQPARGYCGRRWERAIRRRILRPPAGRGRQVRQGYRGEKHFRAQQARSRLFRLGCISPPHQFSPCLRDDCGRRVVELIRLSRRENQQRARKFPLDVRERAQHRASSLAITLPAISTGRACPSHSSASSHTESARLRAAPEDRISDCR